MPRHNAQQSEGGFHADLVTCFLALPRASLGRLRYHLEQKTHICCGKQASWWTDGKGGG